MPFSPDQVAVITGASSGVGKAVALAFAAQGVAVALVGRDRSRLEPVARDLPSGAGKVKCYVADLTQDSDLDSFTEQVLADFGHVDFLAHCAALLLRARLDAATVADFDLQYACNVRAPLVITQKFLPFLLEHQGGVIFINSSAGLGAKPDMGQYAATKHALKAIAALVIPQVHGVRPVVDAHRLLTPGSRTMAFHETCSAGIESEKASRQNLWHSVTVCWFVNTL